MIRGPVEFPSAAMDDFVAVKASGAPLFVLANVVDDIDMAITHVIRGEDLLPTTPRGVLVWEALVGLGWTTDGSAGVGHRAGTPGLPVFAHLPMLVNEQRKKMSKRRDPVAVESYRDQGYLPDAFVNYLALLGWSPPGGEEIFDTDQMVDWFRLEDVNHSPAFFDVAKLTHMNGEYIRAMPLDAFIEACRPWLTGDAGARGRSRDSTRRCSPRMAPLVQERVAVLAEVPAMVDFLFLDQPAIDEESWAKAVAGDELAGTILAVAIDAYRPLAGDLEARRAPRRHPGPGRGRRPQAGQGPGAHPGGGHRPPGRAPAVRGPGGPRPRAHPGPAAERPTSGSTAQQVDDAGRAPIRTAVA